MKKLVILFFLTPLFLTLNSCSDSDNEPNGTNAFAEITVKENSENKAGVTVHMFDENSGPDSSFFTSFYSKKTVITEGNGKATFNLQETFDLDIIDTQTTLYFAVFDGDTLLGKTALTIEKGETKSATINY